MVTIMLSIQKQFSGKIRLLRCLNGTGNTLRRENPNKQGRTLMKIIPVAEKVYSDALAQALDGKREVITPVGRIDVLTESEVIEVKHISGWKAAVGQVTLYAAYYPDLGKRIHLFTSQDPTNEQKLLIEVECCKVGVRVTWNELEEKNETRDKFQDYFQILRLFLSEATTPELEVEAISAVLKMPFEHCRACCDEMFILKILQLCGAKGSNHVYRLKQRPSERIAAPVELPPILSTVLYENVLYQVKRRSQHNDTHAITLWLCTCCDTYCQHTKTPAPLEDIRIIPVNNSKEEKSTLPPLHSTVLYQSALYQIKDGTRNKTTGLITIYLCTCHDTPCQHTKTPAPLKDITVIPINNLGEKE